MVLYGHRTFRIVASSRLLAWHLGLVGWPACHPGTLLQRRPQAACGPHLR